MRKVKVVTQQVKLLPLVIPISHTGGPRTQYHFHFSSSFLLVHTIGNISDDVSTWLLATYVGELAGFRS